MNEISTTDKTLEKIKTLYKYFEDSHNYILNYNMKYDSAYATSLSKFKKEKSKEGKSDGKDKKSDKKNAKTIAIMQGKKVLQQGYKNKESANDYLVKKG